MHEITDEVVQEAKAAGIQQLCPRANIASETAVTKALQAGFSVRGWGIKDTEVGLHGCLGYLVAIWTLSRRVVRSWLRNSCVWFYSAQLLMRMKAFGAQGCTVNWPDRAETVLKQHYSA